MVLSQVHTKTSANINIRLGAKIPWEKVCVFVDSGWWNVTCGGGSSNENHLDEKARSLHVLCRKFLILSFVILVCIMPKKTIVRITWSCIYCADEIRHEAKLFDFTQRDSEVKNAFFARMESG